MLGVRNAILGMLVKYFRCNYTSGSADLLSICFCAVRLTGGFDIYMSGFVPVCTVRSICRCPFVQVGFICVWFDLFLRRLICFLADRFIFAQFDLYLGSWIYLHEFRFIFARFDWLFTVLTLCWRLSFYVWPFNNVCTRFILFILWLENFGRSGTP